MKKMETSDGSKATSEAMKKRELKQILKVSTNTYLISLLDINI